MRTFLSYSHGDRAVAQALAYISDFEGLEIWWDRWLRSTDNLEEDLRTKLDGAKCVAVLWSASSWNSPWVRAEALRGLERGILVCARLDDVTIESPFRDLPIHDLRHWDWNPGSVIVSPFLRAISSAWKAAVPRTTAESAKARVAPVSGVSKHNARGMRGGEEEVLRLEHEADSGGLSAMRSLARMFSDANAPNTFDPHRALEWYRMAASASEDAMDAINLGFWLRSGACGADYFSEAVLWLTRGSLRDLPAAQVALGQMLEEGKGAEIDLERAFFWYDRAAQEAAYARPHRDRLADQLGRKQPLDFGYKCRITGRPWRYDNAKQAS